MSHTVIRVKNVSKRFGRRTVLESIDFEVEAGQIYGIFGANGSGKSVFLRILCGLVRPTTGEVKVFGEQLGKRIEFPRSTGILIDSPGLLLSKSAWENLYLLALVSGCASAQRIREVITLVGLDPDDIRPVGVYSTGMRQRLGLAQALLENPELLILDEPTNGLDFDGQDNVLTLLKELRVQGKTILTTSHSREELANVCDRIYRMAECRLILYENSSPPTLRSESVDQVKMP